MPFFVMVVFWLTIIFTSQGLFSLRNAMVITVLLVCALSTAVSHFLILELDTLRLSGSYPQFFYKQ